VTEATISASRRVILGACRDWPNIVGDFPVDILGGTVTQPFRYVYGYAPAASPAGLFAEFSIAAPGVPPSIVGWGVPWGSQPIYGTPNNGSDFGVAGASAWWNGQTIKARWIYDLGAYYPPLCAVGVMCRSWGYLSIEVSDDGAAWTEIVSSADFGANLLTLGFSVVPIPDAEVFHRYWSLSATWASPYIPGTSGAAVPGYINLLDDTEGIRAFLLWPRSIALRGHVARAAVL
jgi:hypothetical protein